MSTSITRWAWIGLQALALAGAASAQDGATYRQLFDQGVTALGNENFARAAELFSSAGKQAPLAPLWGAYRRLALRKGGLATAPLEARFSALNERRTWSPTDVVVGNGTKTAQLSATGERILQRGPYEAALLDAESGALIARIRPRLHQTNDATQPQRGWMWTFDESGRVMMAAAESLGPRVGLDVRDAWTGRPIEIEGAMTLNPTPGARYEWFALGETPPPCEFKATVDLPSDEGILRCHLVPQAEPNLDDSGRTAVLSSDASLALMRTNTWPTTLWVVDRRTEKILLERSPAGVGVSFSPDESSVYVRSTDDIRKVAIATGEDLWVAPQPPLTTLSTIMAVWTFRDDGLVELTHDGVVLALDEESGVRREIQRLKPAPTGRINDAALVRGGTALILCGREGTSCYDMATGRRRWVRGKERFFEALSRSSIDKAEQRCLILTDQNQPRVVEIDTGDSLVAAQGAAPSRVVATSAVTAIEGEQAVVVALAEGGLRRVELATGGTSAVAPAVDRSRSYFPRSTKAGQLWTATTQGALFLRDPETLDPIRGAACGEDVRFAALSDDGQYAVTTRRDPARTQLVKLTEDKEGEVLLELEERMAVAAFSPSGETLVFAGEGRLLRLDPQTGEVQFECRLLEGVKLTAAAFHSERELVLGDAGQDFGQPHGYVVDVSNGTLIAKLAIPGPGMESSILDIYSDPEDEIVILTTSGYTTVIAFESVEWSQTWNHDFDSGNYGKFALHRSAGSQRVCVSGPPGPSRVFELSTGAKAWQTTTRGLMDLALTSKDRYLIGRQSNRLLVMDGTWFAPLYRREEASDGHAWILNDGTRRPAPGGLPKAVDATHLIHDGWSAPASSFDAWLHDPLRLERTSLSTLPNLPVIQSFTELKGAAGSLQVAITARLDAAIPLVIGAVFKGTAGEESFVAIPASSQRLTPAVPLLLDAPAQGWTNLRLVARSGVLSRPVQRRSR